nr:MAG TPA: hypothetical protein [Caudoviricetes sp.]
MRFANYLTINQLGEQPRRAPSIIRELYLRV